MNTATSFPIEHGLKNPPLVRPLGVWLEALRSIMRAKASPVAQATLTSSAGALDHGRTVWVDQPMAREVTCTQGTLWLTFDGVQKDIVLQAGQSYRCDSASRLAIHALDAARFIMA